MWTRLAGALLAAVRAFFASILRVARQLFHEVTASFFLLFAVIGGVSAWRIWKRGGPEWEIGVAAGFAVLMAWFAVDGFRRARRLHSSQ